MLCALVCVASSVAEDTVDPIHSYSSFHNLTAGRVVYKWSVDLNNDGIQECLLDTKLTAEEISQENQDSKGAYNANVHSFEVYIAKADRSGYTISTGIKDGADMHLGEVLQVDILQCYVGQIKEMNTYGLVTVQTDYPSNGAAVSCIYAYTIEGDHLKRVLMSRYNSTQGIDNIYTEYLAVGKRTQIALQEITL